MESGAGARMHKPCDILKVKKTLVKSMLRHEVRNLQCS